MLYFLLYSPIGAGGDADLRGCTDAAAETDSILLEGVIAEDSHRDELPALPKNKVRPTVEIRILQLSDTFDFHLFNLRYRYNFWQICGAWMFGATTFMHKMSGHWHFAVFFVIPKSYKLVSSKTVASKMSNLAILVFWVCIAAKSGVWHVLLLV